MLTGDKFTPELHLEQAGITHSACEQFMKHCKRIQKIKETGDMNYIHKEKLDKTCFVNDAAFANS